MPINELLSGKIELNKIDTSANWRDIFNTIDGNFELVKLYLENIGSRVKVETFIASKEQKEFILKEEYNTKQNSLSVYRGGVVQWIGEGFKETGNNKFELYEPCSEGEKIVAIYNNFYLLSNYNLDNKSEYEKKIVKVDSDSTRSKYKVTLDYDIDSYVDGMSLIIVPNMNCFENPLININSLGYIELVNKDGEELWGDDLKANVPYKIINYNNKFFVQ